MFLYIQESRGNKVQRVSWWDVMLARSYSSNVVRMEEARRELVTPSQSKTKGGESLSAGENDY